MDRLRKWVLRWWPSLATILVLWGAVAAVLVKSIPMNEGRLVYALDDSYILMAMAKNFACHGVWGMTPFGFTASSSAPLWTLLVAVLYRVFGVQTLIPLLLNLLFATLLAFVAQWILTSLAPTIPKLYVFLVLLCIFFFSPVLNLVFIGLEHTLHIVVTLLFVFQAARILAAKAPPTRMARLALIASGMVTGAARYEGLFTVAVVAVLLFVQRRVRFSVELAGLSLVPATLMGAISVSRGWFWLPNSVMLKGNLPLGETNPLATFIGHVASNAVYSGMRVIRLEGVALLLLLWLCTQSRKRQEPVAPRADSPAGNQDSTSVQVWFLVILVATATLHMLLARTGWFLRYEAYLVALGLTGVAVPIWNFIRSFRSPHHINVGDGAAFAAVALIVLSGNLLWTNGYDAVWMIVPGMHDTYRWHYQMATFVKRYYNGRSLVVNDIGAVDFLADIHLTDPHGLGDREIGRALLRTRGDLNPEFLDQLARSRGATVALVDENWLQFFGGQMRSGVPSTWLLAGVWKFHKRVVLAPPGLSFYAFDETGKAQLIENLRNYSRFLPADVDQQGPYTSSATGDLSLRDVSGSLHGRRGK